MTQVNVTLPNFSTFIDGTPADLEVTLVNEDDYWSLGTLYLGEINILDLLSDTALETIRKKAIEKMQSDYDSEMGAYLAEI